MEWLGVLVHAKGDSNGLGEVDEAVGSRRGVEGRQKWTDAENACKLLNNVKFFKNMSKVHFSLDLSMV